MTLKEWDDIIKKWSKKNPEPIPPIRKYKNKIKIKRQVTEKYKEFLDKEIDYIITKNNFISEITNANNQRITSTI